MNPQGVKVVTIGGGTGSFTLLQALKNYVNHLTAVVNMADDGGSTGVLRDELGALPPGDVRQCLVALADESSIVRELFNYRFGGDGQSLSGHSFGNLFLTALEKVEGDFDKAVETASRILSIRGEVVPVTTDDVTLIYTRRDGSTLEGEWQIAEADLQQDGELPNLTLSPEASLTGRAESALKDADIIMIAPGNLYGSLAPALLTGGMKTALQNSPAMKVYVSNLVTKPGQTTGMGVADHAAEIERFIGAPVLDYVLFNAKKPSEDLLNRYAKEGEFALDYDVGELAGMHYTAVGDSFVSSEIHHQDPHDKKIQRTLIRHDADKVARQLMRLYFS